MNEFKERLAAALEIAGISKRAAAEKVGQPPSAISNFLSGGRRPAPELVERLAEALGVPNRWLADGIGRPPTALLAREREKLESIAWAVSRVQPDGRRTGGNAALFTIAPRLGNVVREAVQNSGDVPLGGGRITIDVRVLGLTGEARSAFLEALRWTQLREHVKASVVDAEHQQVSTALQQGLHIDDGGELLVMLISDYHTKGLIGPERGGGNFAALTRDTMFSSKDSATAGGSFGVGKFTAVRASMINTVLYYSDLSEPEGDHQRGRLLGRCELTWHRDPATPEDEDLECDGPMWLGEIDPSKPAVALSHWAGEGNVLVRDLRMLRDRQGASGTTLAIVGLRDLDADHERTPADMVADLREEAARSFFGAIEHELLEINVDYLQLDSVAQGPDPLPTPADLVRPDQVAGTRPLVEALRAHAQETIVEDLVDDGEVVRARVPLKVPARIGGHPAFTHEAVLLVRRATAEEQEDPAARNDIGKVAMMRGKRMRIKDLDASRAVVGARPFQAVLLAGQAAGDTQEDLRAEEFLRLAEPPAHNNWELTETLRQLYKQGAGANLKAFEKAVRDAVRKIVVRDIEHDSNGPRDLERRFKFGTPPDPPERAPRLIVDESQVLGDGAWEVRGTIRAKGDPARPLHGAVELVFLGETGKRSKVKWNEIEPIRDCTVDLHTKTVTIPAGKRSARFRAISDPASHPVATTDAAVSVAFRVTEGAS